MWLAIHDGAITLGVSLDKKMTEAGTQTAEPVVMSQSIPTGYIPHRATPGKIFLIERILATRAIFLSNSLPRGKK